MSKGLIWMCGIVLVFALCLKCSRPEAEETTVLEVAIVETQDTQTRLQGIDVSHFSGEVDWRAVAQTGIHFAFSKATEGDDFVDPTFQGNWQQKKAHNIIRGAYHFYVVDDDPQLQAQNFINTVNLEPGDLPPVVDIEKAGILKGEALAINLKVWLELIEAHYDIQPIIYTDNHFWDQNIQGDFSKYHLWIAEFETDAVTLPEGFLQWKFWQFQSDAPVEGVPKGADLNHFNGGMEELAALLLK